MPERAGSPALPRASALVYVDDLSAPAPSDEDDHHLRAVLRLRDGEVVIACDGSGSWRLCAFVAGRHSAALRPTGDMERCGRAEPRLAVGFAVVKGDRPDWTVQKLTEIGIDLLVPMITERTVVRLEGAAEERRTARLRRVAREAAMQSRRPFLPEVSAITRLPDLAALVTDAALAAPGGEPPSLATPSVLVGPEGGWSPSELGMFRRKIDLGPLTLRSETAAVAVAVILASLRAGLVASRREHEEPC